MSSALLQLEIEIKDRLESFAFFSPLTVLVEPRKNIFAEITARIGKIKTLVAPKIVGADDNHPNVHGTYFDDLRLAVGIFQNPTLKGNDPDAWEVAEEIHKALKNWTPASLSNALNPVKPGIEPIADPKLNILSCNFAARGGFIGALVATADPVISGVYATGIISITCATPGAVVFCEVGASAPANPTTASALYLASFLAPMPTTVVKARAFMPGRLASKIVTATLTFNPSVVSS